MMFMYFPTMKNSKILILKRGDVVVDVHEILQQMLNNYGWSAYKLAKESNIPYSSLNNMINRNTFPTIPTLIKICSGFDIPIYEFFLYNDDTVIPKILSQRECILLENYRNLPSQQRYLLEAYIQGLHDGR